MNQVHQQQIWREAIIVYPDFSCIMNNCEMRKVNPQIPIQFEVAVVALEVEVQLVWKLKQAGKSSVEGESSADEASTVTLVTDDDFTITKGECFFVLFLRRRGDFYALPNFCVVRLCRRRRCRHRRHRHKLLVQMLFPLKFLARLASQFM